MWPFNKHKIKESPADKAMIDSLFITGITYNPEDGTTLTADITREDIKNWLYAVTRSIQGAYAKSEVVKNWLCGTMHLAGQEIEFYIMKQGGESPLKLLKAEKEKVRILEEKLAKCTNGA